MSGAAAFATGSKRERSRSRFRVVALLGALGLLAACSSHWGPGIAALPFDAGWRQLPIRSWLLNEGLEARAMSFCPRETCTKQGFAALLAFEGRQADALERTLASDPARLARDFAKPASDAAIKRAKTQKPGPPKSATIVSRFSEDGASGLLVEIRALDASGKTATTAILSGRSEGRLLIAFGVSADAAAARAQALAAWRER